MQKFVLYCDLSTMNCTVDDIRKELEEFAMGYIQANSSLWFFKYDDERNLNPLPNDAHLLVEHFDQFTNKESIIFIEFLGFGHCYNLPDDVRSFLEQD